MGEYYNAQHRIPRRASATPDTVAHRQTQTGNALPTRIRHTDDDDDEVSRRYSMKPMARHLDRAPLTATATARHYVIPLTNGRAMRVTEHELETLPQTYQNAAQLVTPQVAAPQPRRQPHPKLPVQDETVDNLPPVRTHPGGNDAFPRQNRRRFPRFHWLFWVGLALCLLLAGAILLTIVATWWQVTQDDWHYGRPRTFQLDWNVGHGTAANPSSHFIALNLNRHLEVIEIPGNDPSKSKIYLGPTLIGPGEDLTPVTLSFEDMNHDGRPDLVLHIRDATFLFLNQKDGTFKPAPNQ